MVSPRVDTSTSAGPQAGFLKKQFTYEEYKEQVALYHEGKIERPDPDDHTDDRYYRKYAHTVPPPDAYF